LHGAEKNQAKVDCSTINCIRKAAAKEKEMKIYGLKNCDTCRKALKALPEFELHDVRNVPLAVDFLQQALEQFGAALVNTRSTTWRNLTESERNAPHLELLQAHPSLMKRPLIERDGTLLLGWTAETRQGLGVE
jgi:arsenate reductase